MEEKTVKPMGKITKQNIINFIKGTVAIVTAAAILVTCSKVLTLKSEDGISQFKSFYKQKENTVDLLFTGSSRVYCNISTGLMWEKFGISSFDLGGAEAPMWNTYYYLKEAFKYQRPKVVAIEASTAALRPTLEPPEFWIEDNDYGMKWNSNRINLLKVQTSDKLFKKIVLPINTMHQRYASLTRDDFIDVNNSINYKGYDSRTTVVPATGIDVLSVTEETPISERAEEYLIKCIELCQSENIPLWLFISPYGVSEEEQKIYNYIGRVAAQNGATFVNLNEPQYMEAMNFDLETDLADEFHVNYSGSEKMVDFLGTYLGEMYDLPDHRGDVNYSSWDVDAMTLRMERAGFALANAESDSEWIDCLSEENFISFINFGEGAARGAIPADVLTALVDLGVPIDELNCGNAIIIKNGKILYSGVSQNFSVSFDNKYDALWFERLDGEDDRAFRTILHLNGKKYELDDEGIEIYAYDASNCIMMEPRKIEMN